MVAVAAREARPTITLIGASRVPADPIVAEGLIVGALVHILVASGSRPTRRATALKAVLEVQTSRPVLTRVG